MNIKFLDLQAINQSFGRQLTDAATGVIQSGWYLKGSQTEAFEAEWGAYCNVKYAVGVGNGLDGLRLVLYAWKLMCSWEDGDEVILPANTFIATALAVSQTGLKPVFCDVNKENALIQINESNLQSLLTERTRCIIPVHLYGQMVDLQPIYDFAERNRLTVLEDACQAHGAKTSFRGKRNCVYSFYPGKNLGALGDGGCVTTDDQELAQMVRTLANYGQTRKYIHDYKGINSRLDEIQAAMLRVKLRRLDSDNKRRIQIAKYYYDELDDSHIYNNDSYNDEKTDATDKSHQLQLITDGSHVYHIFPYLCADRQQVQTLLKEKGIETQIHYPVACHKQKAYVEYNHLSLPNAEYLAAHELSLPISPVLTDEEAAYVINAIRNLHY